MEIHFFPYRLLFHQPFKIAHGVRDGTDIVVVKLSHEGHWGYGEASLPPYLPENQESVMAFLGGVDVSNWDPRQAEENAQRIGQMGEGNMAAKAALEMACWRLAASLDGRSLAPFMGLPEKAVGTAYTLGMGNPEETVEAYRKSPGHPIYKIKMGDDHSLNKARIKALRKVTDTPFFADPNQSWSDLDAALKAIDWMKEQGCQFIEQPGPVDDWDLAEALKSGSSLPLYADEAVKGPADVDRALKGYDGINIKLAKAGGIFAALEMIERARILGMGVLVGCMAESSCAVAAAVPLAAMADYADLDGPKMLKNDPFSGIRYEHALVIAEEPVRWIGEDMD